MADEKPKLPPGATPPPYMPLDPTLANYAPRMIPSYDWGKILAPWSPPLPRDGEVILVSLVGDVFVRTPDRRVMWLEAQRGRITYVARHNIEFDNRLLEEHVAFLKTPLIDQLIQQQKFLKNGQVYGLAKPPVQGGRYEPDNVGAAELEQAFAYWATLFDPRENEERLRRSDEATRAAPATMAPPPAAAANTKPAPAAQPAETPKAEKPKKKGWF